MRVPAAHRQYRKDSLPITILKGFSPFFSVRKRCFFLFVEWIKGEESWKCALVCTSDFLCYKRTAVPKGTFFSVTVPYDYTLASCFLANVPFTARGQGHSLHCPHPIKTHNYWAAFISRGQLHLLPDDGTNSQPPKRGSISDNIVSPFHPAYWRRGLQSSWKWCPRWWRGFTLSLLTPEGRSTELSNVITSESLVWTIYGYIK